MSAHRLARGITLLLACVTTACLDDGPGAATTPGAMAGGAPATRTQIVAPSAATFARVRKVIDGDTITVSGVGTVRLIGVDAPEKTGGYREAEPFGDQATRFMRDLVDGKQVRLEYDGERMDQYKRTLAYVFLEDGTLANEAIIRAGWAETYRRFQYRRKPDFQAAEREARAARRGMWATRR
ncbi:MAG: thermonuclease family protein [Acidobacteriota bacterium]|nr:thermonuclease family protein [Acidobacteriota bacterium]